MFLGLVVSAVVGYSAVRLSVCLVRSHRVTPTLALSTAFRVVAFLYLVSNVAYVCFAAPVVLALVMAVIMG